MARVAPVLVSQQARGTQGTTIWTLISQHRRSLADTIYYTDSLLELPSSTQSGMEKEIKPQSLTIVGRRILGWAPMTAVIEENACL